MAEQKGETASLTQSGRYGERLEITGGDDCGIGMDTGLDPEFIRF